MAEICKWESNKQYDDELLKIEHYTIHPEMLPFIGTEYYRTGILLVGESHYIEDLSKSNENVIQYYKNNWYNACICKEFPNQSWFNTRNVIHNFLVLRRGKGHSMFRNPAIEMAKIWSDTGNVLDSDAFNTCAFMNYFQRPASSNGKSISNTNQDNEKAFKTLNEVIKIIKPQKTIFLSKKAYYSYINNNPLNKPSETEFYGLSHPTSHYWNGDNGKIEFSKIISKTYSDIECIEAKYYNTKNIIEKIKERTEYEIVKKKQFKNTITTQLFQNSNDEVKEIIIRVLTNDKRKIGIGYRFDYRFIWAWDYDKKAYFDSTIDDDEIKVLYNFFIDFIQNL